MRVTQVIAGKPRPAIEAKHRLFAFSETVGNDLVAADFDFDPVIGGYFAPHRPTPFKPV